MSDELKHWGVRGMRWGIRKRRSGSENDSEDHKTVQVIKTKRLSEMSNDELKKLTARLNLEKQYKDLTRKEASSGQKFVTGVLQEVGKEKAKDFITKTLIPKVVPKIQDVVTMSVEQLLKKLARPT